jgi:hypothetical protein
MFDAPGHTFDEFGLVTFVQVGRANSFCSSRKSIWARWLAIRKRIAQTASIQYCQCLQQHSSFEDSLQHGSGRETPVTSVLFFVVQQSGVTVSALVVRSGGSEPANGGERSHQPPASGPSQPDAGPNHGMSRPRRAVQPREYLERQPVADRHNLLPSPSVGGPSEAEPAARPTHPPHSGHSRTGPCYYVELFCVTQDVPVYPPDGDVLSVSKLTLFGARVWYTGS